MINSSPPHIYHLLERPVSALAFVEERERLTLLGPSALSLSLERLALAEQERVIAILVSLEPADIVEDL